MKAQKNKLTSTPHRMCCTNLLYTNKKKCRETGSMRKNSIQKHKNSKVLPKYSIKMLLVLACFIDEEVLALEVGDGLNSFC